MNKKIPKASKETKKLFEGICKSELFTVENAHKVFYKRELLNCEVIVEVTKKDFLLNT